MRVFLSAGFGDPLPADDLASIRSLAFNGIRQDVPDAATAPALIQNLMGSGLQAIFVARAVYGDNEGTRETAKVIVRDAFALRIPAMIEIGNEPDIPEGCRARGRSGLRA